MFLFKKSYCRLLKAIVPLIRKYAYLFDFSYLFHHRTRNWYWIKVRKLKFASICFLEWIMLILLHKIVHFIVAILRGHILLKYCTSVLCDVWHKCFHVLGPCIQLKRIIKFYHSPSKNKFTPLLDVSFATLNLFYQFLS